MWLGWPGIGSFLFLNPPNMVELVLKSYLCNPELIFVNESKIENLAWLLRRKKESFWLNFWSGHTGEMIITN